MLQSVMDGPVGFLVGLVVLVVAILGFAMLVDRRDLLRGDPQRRGGGAAVFGGSMDALFNPSARHTHDELKRQELLGPTAPAPSDPPNRLLENGSTRFGGSIRIDQPPTVPDPPAATPSEPAPRE